MTVKKVSKTPAKTVKPSEDAPNSTAPRPVWEGGQTRADYHAAVRAWKIGQRSS